jgi:hypothetical protein
VQAQAAILDLYDNSKLKGQPLFKRVPSSLEDVDTHVKVKIKFSFR